MAASTSGGIPFIVPDASGRLAVTSEARSFLASLGGGPVAPIAVLGKYRTGKSFLMNNLVGAGGRGGGAKAAGFDVGATVEACTKGVWLWCAPLRRARRNERRTHTHGRRQRNGKKSGHWTLCGPRRRRPLCLRRHAPLRATASTADGGAVDFDILFLDTECVPRRRRRSSRCARAARHALIPAPFLAPPIPGA